jgi:hypothetical protein
MQIGGWIEGNAHVIGLCDHELVALLQTGLRSDDNPLELRWFGMSMDATPNSTASRNRRGHGNPRAQQSRMSNGSKLVNGVDGRSAWVRRAKEQIIAHCQWRGGEANCSSAELSLIRRAACLEVELERMEQDFATTGEAIPEAVDCYARIVGNLRRTFETLAAGLEPRARDVTQDAISEALRAELGQ